MITELYKHGAITKDRPLLDTYTFSGEIPTNGVSYTDVAGNTVTRAIGMRGFDGSIYLTNIGQQYPLTNGFA